MSEISASKIETVPRKRSLIGQNLKEFWYYFSENKIAVVGFAFLVGIILMAIFAGLIAPHDPTIQYRDCLEQPPTWGAEKCNFLFGTDYAGRDMLSRIIHGTRLSLVAGGIVVLLCLSIGIVFGLISGYFRGWVDTVIMRVMDTIMSVPGLLMALVLVAILGPGLVNAMIAISITYLPHFVRLTRASYITESSKEYVIASKVAGAGKFRIMFITILPNCMAPLIVQEPSVFRPPFWIRRHSDFSAWGHSHRRRNGEP